MSGDDQKAARSPEHELQSDSESESEATALAKPFVSRKRSYFLIFIALLCWLAYSTRTTLLHAKKKSKIIHASRYSKDYKYRPAASPVVTEVFKDGRIRLRGALPEQTFVVKKPRKPKAGKVSEKRSSSGNEI